ncbi:MAG: rhodanese-like domain-containing protein [Pseudomonadota bacterium]
MTHATADLSSFEFLEVDALLHALQDGNELAIVDAREEGVQVRDGHLLWSVPLPLSQLELRAGRLLRRGDVRIVVTDAEGGPLAQRTAARLQALGFSDVRVLRGGLAAWRAAGQEVYTGASTYTKAFGEYVEHHDHTPSVSVGELHAKLAAGDDLVVLDGRTAHEFEDFSLPGAYSVPNAELPYRVHGLLRSPETLVVVNCAGRTRSIIGAQALINAGLPNRVVALRNGTMDWLLEGYTLQHGQPAQLPAAPAADAQEPRQAVAHLTQRYDLHWLDDAGLADLQAQQDRRSLYIYDVRTRAEYAAGHLPGSAWIEGGQLVQELDKHVGARHARIVLVDDALGARAAITASWLQQLAWGEVFAYRLPAGAATAVGAEPELLLAPLPEVPLVTADALAQSLADGSAQVIDFAPAPVYEDGHIPGAFYAVRARLPDGLDRLSAQALVATSPDGRLARLAAADLARLLGRPVAALDGGTAAWQALGQPLETGPTALLHEPDDAWRSPYRVADPHAAFREYLRWEIDLLAQIARDPLVAFRDFPAIPARA